MNSSLKALLLRWDRVEERLKEVELLSREVRIPAINELRYAGRQLADGISILINDQINDVEKTIQINQRIVVANQYIQNADNDISDAAVDFLKERINSSLKLYGKNSIAEEFPYIMEIRDRLSECDNLIKESRLNRAIRDENYNKIFTEHLSPRLIPLFSHFKNREPDIIYKSLVLERKYRISKWFNIIVGLAGIFGVILAIAFWIWSWPEAKAAFCKLPIVSCSSKSEIKPPSGAAYSPLTVGKLAY